MPQISFVFEASSPSKSRNQFSRRGLKLGRVRRRSRSSSVATGFTVRTCPERSLNVPVTDILWVPWMFWFEGLAMSPIRGSSATIDAVRTNRPFAAGDVPDTGVPPALAADMSIDERYDWHQAFLRRHPGVQA